jgi:hypothetical protein
MLNQLPKPTPTSAQIVVEVDRHFCADALTNSLYTIPNSPGIEREPGGRVIDFVSKAYSRLLSLMRALRFSLKPAISSADRESSLAFASPDLLS